jgi:hypothetical protein
MVQIECSAGRAHIFLTIFLTMGGMGGIIRTRPVKPFGNRDQLEGNNRYL